MHKVCYGTNFYNEFDLCINLILGSKLLGGVTGLLKAQAGIVGKYVADESQKLLGGYLSPVLLQSFILTTYQTRIDEDWPRFTN